MTSPVTLSRPYTDAEKLLLLAEWFDMWDRPETDRQAILDDPRNPGRNEVQADLRRIAATLDAARAVTETPEGLDVTLRAINRSMDEFVSLTWTEDEYRAAIRAWQRSIRTALAHKEEHGG